ncbi:hypothetical protein Plhal304r1_c031g0100361 [Plasmopara halstedii]
MIMLPVIKVLQFRLAVRLLPVRSRFWFLEATNPRSWYCIQDGYDFIETEQHLFFGCVFPSQRCLQVLELVSPLFVEHPTWLIITLNKKKCQYA